VRTDKFNSALLSTLIIVSLMAPAVSIVLVLTAGQVSAEPDHWNICTGKENAISQDETGDPPWHLYEAGDFPPVFVAQENIGGEGGGKAVAAGLCWAIRDGYWNDDGTGYGRGLITDNHLDVLLDKTFQWMVPSATKVLWYKGYDVYAHPDATPAPNVSDMVSALTAKGYDIGTDNRAFADIDNLNDYEILFVNQLQLGAMGTGGDPDLLPDADVTAIKDFVEGGKGLLVADGSDYDPYGIRQYYKVQNKILKALEFDLYFQNDSVNDPVNNYESDWQLKVDVNTNHPIGSAYYLETGKTTLGFPSSCSLAPLPNYGVSITISPGYLEGLPGGTLKPYEVKVTNMGKLDDNYTLTATDNSSWGLTISGFDVDNKLEDVPGFFNSRTVTLSVNVPGDAVPGMVDNVLITVNGTGTSDNYWILAIAGRQIRPTIDDSQVLSGEPDRDSGAQSFMYVGSENKGRYGDERAFLKFDLQGIASLDNINTQNARLFVYGFLVNGTPGNNVELLKVENDDWVEENMTWNNKPAYGTEIGTEKAVTEAGAWYSWDVTSYVAEEFADDNFASFCIKAETETLDYPDNFSYGFDTKEFSAWAHPRIAIGRNVWITIDPEYREGLPGGTVKYYVNVWNMGSVADTYDLSVDDNASWSPTILPSSLSLSAGQKGTATVSVTIPVDAEICVENDNITVTATSQNDSTVKDDAWVIAHPANRVKPAMPDTSTRNGEFLAPTIWGIDDTIYVGRYAKGPERGWLRFDLQAIPNLENIARARLNLQCSSVEGEGAIVQVYSMANDAWIKDENWTSIPPIDNLLDTRAVIEAGTRYSWDVTDFVKQEFQSDNEASFALVHLGENIVTVESAARFLSMEEFGAENEWPYLEILHNTQIPQYDVRTSISPIFQGGTPGTTLDYTVTVTNTGTSSDTYDLTVDDNRSWGATPSPTPLTIAAGASDSATLSVTVPDGLVCTLDRITVTATGNGVSDDALCYAHLSRSILGLEHLYKLGIDLNIRLREDADKLVAKFYTLGDDNEGEGVVWENIMPWYLDEPKEVPHPWGQVAVKKVRLVLVDETDAEWLVASFTLNRDALFGRIMGIKGEWPLPGSDRNALFQEIMDIKGLWPIV